MYFNSIIYLLMVSSVCISSQESHTTEIYSGNQSYLNLTLADKSFRYLGATIPVASDSDPEITVINLTPEATVINLTPEPQEALQEALELEALQEAIASPRIGLNGEDRTASAPREGSGKGRQDDIRPIYRSNPTERYRQGPYGKSEGQMVEINERLFLLMMAILFLAW